MAKLQSSTVVDRFRELAQRQPEHPLFTFLLDGERQEDALTRGELDAQARAIAAELMAQKLTGRCVLLLYVPGLDFVASLLGCLYAGVIAVPAYPPDPMRLARTLPRLQAIVADCAPALVLTTTPLLQLSPMLLSQAPELAAVPWAASDAWARQVASRFTPPDVRPSDLALIQYTSGSTAMPKGVMLGHDNLIANLSQLAHARRGGEHSTIVSWLPFYHDLGLIGAILLPLFLGGRSILLSPLDFLQRPLRWLQAIHAYRADTSAAPNFALDLCARKISQAELAGLDLSCWTMALIGAEPLRDATLARFCELLAPCGFHPHAIFQGYGLAEGVLASVCGTLDARYCSLRLDAAALTQREVVPATARTTSARTLVSCGNAMPGQRIEIVDPDTGCLAAPGRVGEIWISGPNVARGYWNRPAETAATFGARLADSGPFLRSGDLGFVVDGEIYVAGRIKDLIVIRGKNHYPQDIEQTVEACHPAVRSGGAAAFSIDEGHGERLVVVTEVDCRALPAEARQTLLTEIAEALRREVGAQHDLHVHALALLEPGQLPKTSSGKVMRSACRSDFLNGKHVELHRSPSPSERAAAATTASPSAAALPTPAELAQAPAADRATLLEWHLRNELSGVLRLQLDRLASDTPLLSLGMDSLMGFELKSRLEETFQVELPATLLWEHPTIGSLAIALAAKLVGGGRRTRIGSVSRERLWPLSFAQQRLWFLDQFEPDSSAYNIGFVLKLSGPLNLHALTQSLDAIVARHEVLRTSFAWVDGVAVQRIQPASRLYVETQNLQNLDATEREAAASRIIAEQLAQKFDLRTAPLLRAKLLQVEPAQHRLAVTVHHIVADGWSQDILMRELGAYYRAFHQGHPSPLPELPIQYVDYASWQRQSWQGEHLAQQLSYWQTQLAGAPALLALPTDRPRPAIQTCRGATRAIRLPRELREALQRLGQRVGTTPYMTFLAAFQILLHFYTGSEDIVIGTPIANRTHPEVMGLIGFFVNTLILRTSLAGNPTFAQLLARVKAVTLAAYGYQELPFEKLVEALNPVRNLSYQPICQVAFTWQKVRHRDDALPDLESEFIDYEDKIAKMDLTLTMLESENELSGVINYNTDLFDAATIDKMLVNFQGLLAGIQAEPERAIGDMAALMELPAQGGSEQPKNYNLLTNTNLTRHQLLIWMGERLHPDAPIYNMAHIFELAQPIEAAFFQHAFQSLINSSDALRTIVVEVAGIPQQQVLADLRYELALIDLSHSPDAPALARAWAEARARRPLDFTKGLFDSALLKLAGDRFVFYLNQHQFIADATSTTLVLRTMLNAL